MKFHLQTVFCRPFSRCRRGKGGGGGCALKPWDVCLPPPLASFSRTHGNGISPTDGRARKGLKCMYSLVVRILPMLLRNKESVPSIQATFHDHRDKCAWCLVCVLSRMSSVAVARLLQLAGNPSQTVPESEERAPHLRPKSKSPYRDIRNLVAFLCP